MTLTEQIIWLFILALPVACIAWTVTHEEVFFEPRQFCIHKSKESKTLLQRKFFYLFTCEYCFSHYVTAAMLIITRYHLLFNDWRGYLISGFALVWIANAYMSLFGLLRVDIRKERLETEEEEVKLKQMK
ncbi:MAG: hypothetical protein IPO83_04275 [Chitinophagaceae bacterium]|nr:hypothetical protein [Chitinophagaceae bacterium]